MKRLIAALEKRYGRQRPKVTHPFHQVLWENVAYLANDATRALAFATLEREVGLTPKAILGATETQLREATGFGLFPEQQAEKLVASARLAVTLGDLRALAKGPLAPARRAFKKFPGIGAPGADRILLLSGAQPTFSVDSNGLRVLTRVGFGKSTGSYDAVYRSALAAVGPLPKNVGWLQRAALVLRRHGQETCVRSTPDCAHCPLASRCAFARAAKVKAPSSS